jgi:DNA-binding GntR family transcriptional regulator
MALETGSSTVFEDGVSIPRRVRRITTDGPPEWSADPDDGSGSALFCILHAKFCIVVCLPALPWSCQARISIGEEASWRASVALRNGIDEADEAGAARPIRRRPLHDEVTERLRDMIVEGELAPGERVNEVALCELLGVSRTPLREALKILAAEGLVDLLPRRGARVATLGAGELVELFEVLSGLERTAAELAATRATREDLARLARLQARIERHHAARNRHDYAHDNHALHEAIVKLAGNAVLKEVHERLMMRVRRARYMALLSQERWDESVAEHAGILAALEGGDARRAGELMHGHVARTGDVVRAALASGGEKTPA